jgi:hypothetical protein
MYEIFANFRIWFFDFMVALPYGFTIQPRPEDMRVQASLQQYKCSQKLQNLR